MNLLQQIQITISDRYAVEVERERRGLSDWLRAREAQVIAQLTDWHSAQRLIGRMAMELPQTLTASIIRLHYWHQEQLADAISQRVNGVSADISGSNDETREVRERHIAGKTAAEYAREAVIALNDELKRQRRNDDTMDVMIRTVDNLWNSLEASALRNLAAFAALANVNNKQLAINALMEAVNA